MKQEKEPKGTDCTKEDLKSIRLTIILLILTVTIQTVSITRIYIKLATVVGLINELLRLLGMQ